MASVPFARRPALGGLFGTGAIFGGGGSVGGIAGTVNHSNKRPAMAVHASPVVGADIGAPSA